MSKAVRLLAFNVYDKENTNEIKEKEFEVQMFGLNEKGETFSLNVKKYTPFFYVIVGDSWGEAERAELEEQVRNDIGDYHSEHFVSTKLLKRKKLYGFDGGKEYNFVLLKFKCESTMKKTKNLWFTTTKKNDTSIHHLNEKGYECCEYETRLYESNIPPLLRLFHIRDISPTGWIALPNNKTRKQTPKKTSCHFEFIIDYNHIIPLTTKETPVPYKICSFDIEASSSHGDFPLAEKTYKKLAQNIVDEWEYYEDGDTKLFNKMVNTSFGFEESVEDIDLIYVKKTITKEKLHELLCEIHKLNVSKIDDMDYDYKTSKIDDEVHEEVTEERELPFWLKNKSNKYKKKGTLIDLLNDDIERDVKIHNLNNILTYKLPKVEGDKITFIGSTFMKYGDTKPYLNHCISSDTCENIEGAVIEQCNNEKELMLAWTKIIQKEDPDILIGYNIFGFDYQFMFSRAKELNIMNSFMKLSRNKNELCYNKDYKTGKMKIEESSLVIASGQHDLKYIKMNGRVQIDMYNYLRRDYSLMQYKLDYVAGYFIGDYVKKLEYNQETDSTYIYTKNITGIEIGTYVNFEEESHSIDSYKDGEKFMIQSIDKENKMFTINGNEKPDMNKKVRWGLSKDDVTPQDIFRMTNEGPKERAVIAKYCIQDCNLVHHLLNKIDVITGFIEMAKLCSVPMEFLVLRGQGIKLTSYIAKKCREKNTLMPVIDKCQSNEGYEGAIVLEPKCNLYLEEPVACVDFSSLYPSAMISENISHDSKVWTKEYNNYGKIVREIGEKNEEGIYIYDNLEGYKYVDIQYDSFKWQRKGGNEKSALEKVKVGYKVCRFAQYNEGNAIMPSILKELLVARKQTRKQIPNEKDDFMKNILDKRQLSIKITANSMYGQTGAKTSTFYEQDCAASTTAIGRKLLTYAKRVIEEGYKDRTIETQEDGLVKTNAEYVYGDTDSVFFKFNLKTMENKDILGQKALKITIELAKQAGILATKFLKGPHDLEYEKTFLPFCLLSKKRYVGLLYEDDPNKCYRKSMGIVLKRRDNAPIVKDVYGGIIDILMKEKNVEKAVKFLKDSLQDVIDEKYNMDKLIITKSLRSGYKNPKQIAHKVLADRIGKRDPGNKPSVGDRIPFVYIHNPDKKALQGERIEHPKYIEENNIKINYSFYITNQIMKPVQQVFALVLEQLSDFKKKKGFTLRTWKNELESLRKQYKGEDYRKKEESLRNKEVKAILFDPFIRKTNNMNEGLQSITSFFG